MKLKIYIFNIFLFYIIIGPINYLIIYIFLIYLNKKNNFI